jgi:hypothetical protein
MLYAVYTRALCYVNLCKHFTIRTIKHTIRIENNMIRTKKQHDTGLARAIQYLKWQYYTGY